MDAVLRSTIAYKDFRQKLSELPLQQIFNFAMLAKGYELQISNIALVAEKEALKTKLVAENGEFGQKQYDYIYKSSIEEKYSLLNQVLQSIITEEEASPLKAKHIKIISNELSYEHCMEIRNAEDKNDILENYYCFNEEQQILYCYILVNGNKNFEIVGQF